MIKPFENKIWLSSPTMHGEELQYMQEAYETNWMSTVGANINEVERITCELIGCKEAVGLSSGTAALHLAIKLAGERLYGRPKVGHGTLEGKKVFCTDMTFDATINPVAYEGGEAVFIDSEYETWNVDPAALEKAFALYPDVKLIVLTHLYGTPAKMDEIRAIADAHGALIVEDAAESLGATYKGKQTGCFGDYSIISFNGNKIITGSSGGMLLCDDKEAADKARKWSTQSREPAPWYQHEELGYNYRMSNVIAGVIRGQYPHLEEHIVQKKAIYNRYASGLAGLPLMMNPVPSWCSANYWLSCCLIDRDAMCEQVRGDLTASYASRGDEGRLAGTSCPTEILEKIAAMNAEGRPIWKPMHMQPMYSGHAFVTVDGGRLNGSILTDGSVGADIFERGLCLPSDNKMTMEQVDIICEIIKNCFK